MPVVTQTARQPRSRALPATMQAAVYRGKNDVRLETVLVPEISAGELLLRIHTCGICGTDLKKISTGSHSAPRIFGHEIAGQVVAVGEGVREYKVGDRVMAFHHIPCGDCFYCQRKVFAQCPVYKKVGITAGFEPSGGGFAQYVRVMPWIVERGVIPIPDDVSYEQAAFIEPVNTCLKAIEEMHLETGEVVLVIGQGPIGIILGVLAAQKGARVIGSDMFAQRLAVARQCGIKESIDASEEDLHGRILALTEGRGADAVILAVGGNALIQPAIKAARPGGRVLLFAQTQHGEATFDPAAVCVDEKKLLGSYSASIELQQQAADLVFGGAMDFRKLISHRFRLSEAVEALHLAAHPQPDSLKIVVSPGLEWEAA